MEELLKKWDLDVDPVYLLSLVYYAVHPEQVEGLSDGWNSKGLSIGTAKGPNPRRILLMVA